MKLKDTIATISANSGIPAGQVRKICLALLENMAACIDSQEDFRSPVIICKSFTVEAKAATEDVPAKPLRKLARMSVNPRYLNKVPATNVAE